MILLTKRPAKGGKSEGQGSIGRRRGDRRHHMERRVPPRAFPSLNADGRRLFGVGVGGGGLILRCDISCRWHMQHYQHSPPVFRENWEQVLHQGQRCVTCEDASEDIPTFQAHPHNTRLKMYRDQKKKEHTPISLRHMSYLLLTKTRSAVCRARERSAHIGASWKWNTGFDYKQIKANRFNSHTVFVLWD